MRVAVGRVTAAGVAVGREASVTAVGVAPALALFAGVGVEAGKTASDTVVDVAPALASFSGVGAAGAMIGVAGVPGVVGSGGRGSSVAGTAVADDLSSPPGRADSVGSASAPSSVHATTMSNAVASMTIRNPLTNREPRFTRFFADFHILRPSHFRPAPKRGVTPISTRASAARFSSSAHGLRERHCGHITQKCVIYLDAKWKCQAK